MTHEVSIVREEYWPHQWIGKCRCGVQMRVNTHSQAIEYFTRCGCRPLRSRPSGAVGGQYQEEAER